MVSASICVCELSSLNEVEEKFRVGDLFNKPDKGDWGGTGVGGGYMNGS